LPKQTLNLTLKKIENGEEKQATAIITTKYGEIIEVSEETAIGSVSLTGQAITRTTGWVTVNLDEKPGLITRFFTWLKKLSITGKVVSEEEPEETVKIEITDNALQYEIEYYTEAPELAEQNISENQKNVTISADDELNYTDILADIILPSNVSVSDVSNVKLYYLVDGEKEEQEFELFDNNEDGIIDYISWTVPHLSEQNYEVIIMGDSGDTESSASSGGGGGGSDKSVGAGLVTSSQTLEENIDEDEILQEEEQNESIEEPEKKSSFSWIKNIWQKIISFFEKLFS
jgi:hypothetical protein